MGLRRGGFLERELRSSPGPSPRNRELELERIEVVSDPTAVTVDHRKAAGIRFEEVRGDEGCTLPWHGHPETFLDLHLEGETQVSWHAPLGAQTLSLLPAGFEHRSLSLRPFHTFQVAVPVEWLEEHASWARAIGTTVFDASRPVQAALQMFRCFSRWDDLTEADLECLMLDFWVAAADVTEAPLRPAPGWMKQAEEYLRDRFTDSVSPSEVASVVGIDAAHLMREFRRRHRCTVGGYVRSLRVERACQLLKQTSVSCAEVAHAVGFADQSHFNRTFRDRLGIAPSEYVLEVRNHS